VSDPDQTELETTRRHIREGAEQIARQRDLLSRLRPRSEAAKIARQVLAQLEEAQRLHVAHLENLLGHE
jgi:hypothetical protein